MASTWRASLLSCSMLSGCKASSALSGMDVGSRIASFGPASATPGAERSVAPNVAAIANLCMAKTLARALKHHRGVDPCVDSMGIVHFKALSGIVDRAPVVRVRRAGNRGRARGGGLVVARPGFAGIAREVRIARLVEGDEVRLHQRVAAADMELDVLTGLPRKFGAQPVR